MRVSINRILERAKGLQSGEFLSQTILLRRDANQERDFELPLYDWLGGDSGTLREGLFLLSCVEGNKERKLTLLLELGKRLRSLVLEEPSVVRYLNELKLFYAGSTTWKNLSDARAVVSVRLRALKGMVRDKRAAVAFPNFPNKGDYSVGECAVMSKVCALTYFLSLDTDGLDDSILLLRAYAVSAMSWDALSKFQSDGVDFVHFNSFSEISAASSVEEGLELETLRAQFLTWKGDGL